MADKNLTELDAVTDVADTDIVYVVRDPLGGALDRVITGANLKAVTSGAAPVQSVQGLTGVVSLPSDDAAATPSLRTLGSTGTQAAAGNDSRLSDARPPTEHGNEAHSSTFVDAAAAAAAAPVQTVNGQTGTVALDAAAVGADPAGSAAAAQAHAVQRANHAGTQDIATVNGLSDALAAIAPDLVAVAAVAIDQDNVVVVGRGAPNEQTIELRHVTADGQTETLMATVTVAAGVEAAQTPPAFSRAFVRGDRFRAVRTAGTGDAPVVTVAA